MANDDELKIKITLDGDQANASAKNVQKSIKGIADETVKTDKELSRLEKTAAGVGVALATAFSARAVKGLIDIADDTDNATAGLERLAKQSGATADQLLGKLRTATKGFVADLALIQAANKGLQLGIKPEDLDSVASAALRVSKEFGGDIPSAMERFNTAMLFGKKSTLALFGDLKDGSITLEGFSGSVDSLSDVIAQSQVQFNNWLTSIGQVINTNPQLIQSFLELKTAVEGLGPVLKDVAENSVSLLAKSLNFLRDTAFGAVVAVKTLGKVWEQTQTGQNGNLRQAYNDVIQDYVKALSGAGGGSSGGSVGSGAIPATIKFGKALDEQAKAAKKAAQAVKEFNATIKDLFVKLTNNGTSVPMDDLAQATEDLNVALRKAGGIENKEFFRSLEDSAAKWIAAGKAIDQYTEALKEAGRLQGIFQDINQKNQDAIAQKDSETKALGLEIGQAIAEGIGDALKIAFSKGAKTEEWSSAIGNVAGKTANIAVTSALKDTLEDFAPVAGEVIGSLVSEVTDNIVKAFGGKDTPGTTARKAADKWFAELFNAERLAVVVKGEMKRIDDLVFKGQSPFGGNISGFAKDNNGFAALLGLDAASQGGFTAVGTALENLLGVAQDISGQIAAVLVNNIGGSLQNLQVLVQQTGFTFEEMSNAIVESFYAGQLSIQETATALANLQGIFEVGIPGAIGAVNEAWANFEASVAEGKGSRFLIDSIRDIGAEAQELGISTFPQLADQLVRVFGFSANQVTAFFEAMKAVGIQNIQELVNASTENLINLAANYQQIIQGLSPGFGPAAVDPARTAQVRYPSTRLSTPKIAKDPAKVKDSFDASKDSVKVLSKLFRTFEGDLKAIGAAADLIGISMKDLESSITKAFKRGEIGAKEALNQFKKYKDAFTSGIAGKTGAVGEAIQNLIKTGAQGGVLTLNAFKGILTEAKEGRVSTLGGLVDIFRQQLGDGASDKLREALKGEGINSFKALQEASEDTIVRILGNMEKLGFPFETTSKKTKDLLKEINKIGKTPPQEIKVVLKIKAEATDKNSAKVLNALPEVGRSIKKLINTGQGIELQ